MPKLSAEALKARINELQKQLAAAEANKAPAIKKVKALMKKLGVTVADLTDTPPAPQRGRPPKTAKNDNGAKKRNGSKGPRGAVPIKYRDEKGNTWTGRGKTPRWLAEAEKNGATRENYLIK